MRAPDGSLNEAFLKDLLDAQAAASMARAKAEAADAKVSLVRAKIEAAGKQVVWDYNDGRDTVRVVDRES